MEIFIVAMTDADVKIIAAVIAAFGSLTTGTIVAIISHSRTKSREIAVQEKISERELLVQQQIRQREIEESHRQKKVEIYNDFIKLVSSFMQADNPDNKKGAMPKQKVLNEVEKFNNGILLWGGPRVMSSYLDYRKVVGEENPTAMFKAVDVLYKEIRQDIGLSNEGLDNLETIQMYLSDPDEISELIET